MKQSTYNWDTKTGWNSLATFMKKWHKTSNLAFDWNKFDSFDHFRYAYENGEVSEKIFNLTCQAARHLFS